MPMPWQRRLFRGIDHAAVIASSVAAELDVPMAQVLAKENGPPQTTLKAGQRRAGWGQEMRVRRRWGGWGLNDDHVVLVDDVRTTGETVRKAARLIRQEGVSRILVAVVAVADGAYRRATESLAMMRSDDPADES
ncbi:MAG TPA: phosphoribosyltransferase family protein [Phycisphaerales bacterium]|nr:phosphoribosyltransferase family protein [Phycisphaerales bacterium]HRQ74549.1 phosphoribosyltransferase family protein [Phycisphaerales bacterium]